MLICLHSYIGSLFSIKGPRDTTALLDIERAFNKLEKVAVKRRNESGRPLLLIINNIHFVRDDDDGRDLLEMLQQRAELWAASNLITVGKLRQREVFHGLARMLTLYLQFSTVMNTGYTRD